MSIKYRIVRRQNSIAPGNKSLYIMQAISTGHVGAEQLSHEISNESTLTKTDVAAVLTALGEKMKMHLEEGKTLSLENIGSFKIGFKSQSKSDKNLLRKKEVSKFHINYQPAPKLKRWLKNGLPLVKEKKAR